MFYRHHTDKLLIPVGLLVVLFLTSYRPTYHLRSEMPAAFFEQDQKSQGSSQERKIAWAYWESALMNVQWQYPYSHPLPSDPPSEFQVNANGDPVSSGASWLRNAADRLFRVR